jgi:hypothetical protein
MGQYSELVAKRRDILRAEEWAKKVKYMAMEAHKDGRKLWTTVYNNGDTQYEDENGNEEFVAGDMTIQDCIDEMQREDADANRTRH